jgi:PAT family beta-lactamase induction signal transducer AmpG
MNRPITARKRSPWLFVPVLYFLQGIPYFFVDTVSTTLFKRLGVPIDSIGHWSSLLTLPWTLKPLWSPVVDLRARKRSWIVAAQILAVAGMALCARATTGSDAVAWCVIACAWIALCSATHDIACDGFYLLALDTRDQAAFVGVRSAAYRLARIFVTGGVVKLAGALETRYSEVPRAWMFALGAVAGVYAIGGVWNAWAMPRPAADGPVRKSGAESAPPFVEALVSYFRGPRILAVLAFIVTFRFGESMLVKMSSPFLLSTAAEGGLDLTTEQVGDALGTIGALALVAGGVLGGFVIARAGLRRCLWPMVIAMHAPNLLYAWAAFTHPALGAVKIVIAVEQLGYGFGFSAYMVYLMHVSRGSRWPTTHYAISTGLMALSALVAGFISGDIVKLLGFAGFFVVVCLCSIPGMLTLIFIPLYDDVSGDDDVSGGDGGARASRSR